MPSAITKYRFFCYLHQLLVPVVFTAMLVMQANAQTQKASNYLAVYAPMAKKYSLKTGIPASVILGVAIVESGFGSSKNAQLLNNHFGIKGKNNLTDLGIHYGSKYKSYTSAEAGYGHFCTVIKHKFYFKQLKGNPDYKLWLLKMNSAYYSSAGLNWYKKIEKAIKVYKLYKLDEHMYTRMPGTTPFIVKNSLF